MIRIYITTPISMVGLMIDNRPMVYSIVNNFAALRPYFKKQDREDIIE